MVTTVGTLIPFVDLQFFDENGAPAAGYFLYSFAAGTTTPQATYSDYDLQTQNDNPIELDAAGRSANPIFLSQDGSYKFELASTDAVTPPASPIWSRDNVAALLADPQPFTSSIVFELGIKGGAALSAGIGRSVYVPYAFTITGYTLVADQVGSIVLDVWRDSYANYPPSVADTIAGSEKPTIAAAIKTQDTNLTTWTTAITAGNCISVNIDSAATITWCSLTLHIQVG